jgi:hypothetical protein
MHEGDQIIGEHAGDFDWSWHRTRHVLTSGLASSRAKAGS